MFNFPWLTHHHIFCRELQDKELDEFYEILRKYWAECEGAGEVGHTDTDPYQSDDEGDSTAVAHEDVGKGDASASSSQSLESKEPLPVEPPRAEPEPPREPPAQPLVDGKPSKDCGGDTPITTNPEAGVGGRPDSSQSPAATATPPPKSDASSMPPPQVPKKHAARIPLDQALPSRAVRGMVVDRIKELETKLQHQRAERAASKITVCPQSATIYFCFQVCVFRICFVVLVASGVRVVLKVVVVAGKIRRKVETHNDRNNINNSSSCSSSVCSSSGSGSSCCCCCRRSSIFVKQFLGNTSIHEVLTLPRPKFWKTRTWNS